VSFRVEDRDAMLWGGELVRRAGRATGQVTSAAWSQTFNCCVGLAWVEAPVDEADDYEVDVGGARHRLELSRKPLYDAGNKRIHG
jgi:4-methylaminobutanoate oxidase (formaldehyde-forming)